MKILALKLWNGWIRPIAVVVLVVGSFRSAVADWNDVPTGSMKPTILEGDRIVVNKLAYDLKVPFTRFRLSRWDAPGAGEIVVLLSPADGTRLVKRVVGIPGDQVAMVRGRLVVNGRPLSYGPADPEALPGFDGRIGGYVIAEETLGETPHAMMIRPGIPALRTFAPIEIPSDHYFVMGDNRDESSDSRVFGLVHRDAIVGRATAVAASVDPQRYYLPRWPRFFHGLR